MVPLLSKPEFPAPEQALEEPNGLLAASSSLTVHWLLPAYEAGIFPWFDQDGGPVLWWSPDPRAVLFPERLRVSRSLRKVLRSDRYTVTMDRAFSEVIDGCAGPRRDGAGTWITETMRDAYCALHARGYAHSVETWLGEELAGGLYGVSLGGFFFGESMFARHRDASKVALCALVATVRSWQFKLIDCQIMNEHLRSLGAEDISRAAFLDQLARNEQPNRVGPWTPVDLHNLLITEENPTVGEPKP